MYNRRKWLQFTGAAGLGATMLPNTLLAKASERPTAPLSSYDYAKLDANENPFGPSPKVRQAMIDAFDSGCRYPFQKMNDLATAIAKKEGVTRSHIVMVSGSMEGLEAAGLTYGVGGGEIITANPVYKSLLTYAEHFGAYINKVPVTSNMQHDLAEMEKRVTNKTSLVFICNPNNPTGALIPKDQLVDFCSSVSKQAVVFSDEAYYDFITDPNYPSMVDMVKKGENVIVSRTFSKVYALAGLRVGYLIARPDIASRIRKNVMARANIMALTAAEAALNDDAFYQMSLDKANEAKAIIYKTLDELKLEYIPSHTNFVFFHSGMDIKKLQPMMRKKKVAVGRPFPPLNDWCRVSTGKIEDVQKFCSVLKEVLG